jgi:signal transduction histidine kinase
MSNLIDDLLQLSRIGRVQPRYETLDLAALARTLAEELDARLRAAGATLHVADALPPVRADRARVLEVLENLVSNALKYARKDGRLRIEIGGYRTRSQTRVFVRDDGPGIAPEYHRRIFGLFQRLDTGPEGTGAGLAIVAKIMKLHGGRAWVESTPGEGATFWLAFPNVPETQS